MADDTKQDTKTKTDTKSEEFAGLKERLTELTDQKNEWKQKYEELHAQSSTFEEKITGLETQLEEATKTITGHTMERAFLQAGYEYDQDLIDLMELKYGKVEAGEDGGKPDFETWLAEHSKTSSLFRKRASGSETAEDKPKSEPTQAPEDKKAEGGDAQEEPETKSKPPTKDPADTRQPAPADPSLNPDQMLGMSHDDYATWRQNNRLVVR